MSKKTGRDGNRLSHVVHSIHEKKRRKRKQKNCSFMSNNIYTVWVSFLKSSLFLFPEEFVTWQFTIVPFSFFSFSQLVYFGQDKSQSIK